MSTTKYRKKPVEIEAVQYEGNASQRAAINRWMAGDEYVAPIISTRDIAPMVIGPLEAAMAAWPGDWIIRGARGEFYPCKPGIFEATYEPVEESR